MPRGVASIHDAATEIDPDARTIGLRSGSQVSYDFLIVCPGIQLDWDRLPGSAEALGTGGVTSNYAFEHAPLTWEMIRSMRSGTAVFSMPAGPHEAQLVVGAGRAEDRGVAVRPADFKSESPSFGQTMSRSYSRLPAGLWSWQQRACSQQY